MTFTSDERDALLRLLKTERDAAKDVVHRITDLIDDETTAVSPDDRKRWHDAAYMEGWDDAVDTCWRLIRAAIRGAA